VKAKLLNEDGQRTFALVFDTDDEVAEGLLEFAREHRIESAQLTGIGALRDVTFAFFEWTTKKYEELRLDEQVEVLTLAGDIALEDGEPALHTHLVVGKRDGTAHGGHLIRAHVRPTLEVILVESPTYLRREIDAETGLPLIRIDHEDSPD
jgi:uncharacterized protein